MESLGGPDTHHKKSGVYHIVADDELDVTRAAVVWSNTSPAGHFDRSKAGPATSTCTPCPRSSAAPTTCTDRRGPAGLRRSVRGVPVEVGAVDGGRPGPALRPRTVGVLANNPLRLGGCLNSSAEKAARFVRLCNAFGIPLVVIVDVPGYLPGVDPEWTAWFAAAPNCCTPSARRRSRG